ncbi:hypothetical protein AAC391_02330, partial [Trueperella pyogenes]|nr:hypothetical protein [Trueperella pyogenes]
MEDWADIRFLRQQSLSIRAIASQVGCAKKTVERALASNRPPQYRKREGVASAFDAYEEQVLVTPKDCLITGYGVGRA